MSIAQLDRETVRRRDADTTRTSILDSAESVFVERGFAATALSEVAQRAGVTKSLIHHHFGSKEALWQVVKRRRLQQYAEEERKFILEGDPSRDRFSDSIRRYFRFLEASPDWVRLSTWMSLEDPLLATSASPELMEAGLLKIQEAQRRGLIRDDVDPRNVVIAFLSQCMHWFQSQHSYGGLPEGEEADNEQYLEDFLKIFFEGVEKGREGTC